MRRVIFTFFFLISFFAKVNSQPGNYYQGFATGGILISGEGVVLDELAVAPDGKVITISPRGIFQEPYGQIDWSALVKYNANGTLDQTFGGGDGSVSFVTGPNGTEIKSLVMQPDGKFLVIKKGSNAVWRFKNTNGLDPDFAGDGSFELTVAGYPFCVLESMTLDNLGRIIVSGRAISSGVTTPDRLLVARLNTDGTPDETFSFTGVRIVLETTGLYYKGVHCAADNSNRIIVSVDGFHPGPPASRDNFITRFNENGSIDLTFGTSGRFNTPSAAWYVGADQQNRVVIGVGSDVKRLAANGGSPQTIFSSVDIKGVTIQANGKIVITGDEQANAPTHSRNLWLRRFTENGGADQSFGTNGKVLTNLQINLSPRDIYYIDRKIYVCGMVMATAVGTSNLGFIIAYDATDTKLHCPSIDTIPTNAGVCYATPNNLDPVLMPSGDMNLVTYKIERNGSLIEEGQGSVSGKQFPKGKTKVTYTHTDITTQVCSFDVIVADKEAPAITCPTSLTVYTDPGKCYATVSVQQLGTLQTQDNCTSTVTTTPVLPAGNKYDKGITSLVWKVADDAGNSNTCTQTITVVDNEKPVLSAVSLSTYVLSPPNHKMYDVTVNYTASDNCGVTTTLSVTSDEPQSGLSNADNPTDWEILDDHHVRLRAERDPRGDGRVYTITITATDVSGNTTTDTRTVVVSHNITGPQSGATVKIGSTVNLAGTFWDVAGNRHTAKWMIDDKSVSGTVKEPSGMNAGTVTGSYKFTTAGVYKLQMSITDQKGLTTYTTTNGDYEAIIVVYDPNGGYTYGGGNFASPQGALVANPSARGDAGYGFTMNYYKNASMPKGETQFDFKVGDFEFNALNFEYLVINNSMAQFKGTGRIMGGQSGIGFIMTVTDGQMDATGTDKIRMKIYNKNNGSLIYDNQPGASDAALPSQAVGANSTVVINGANAGGIIQSSISNEAITEKPAGLEIVAYPNPSPNVFSIMVKGDQAKGRILLQITDMYGRTIENKNVVANSTIQFGDTYSQGTYIARVIQGNEHREIKLIKLSR